MSSLGKGCYRKPMGTYVPPSKRVKSEQFDVGSEDYQRAAWDTNKRKITGLINKASTNNVTVIVKELFRCNLIRYKGLFASALLKAQETSPVFTDVYAAILAVINSRIKLLGSLVINRLILQYRLAFINNSKSKCLSSVKLIAHLTNQSVVDDVLAFQLINHLMNRPTPSSIEILITFLQECGAKLDEQNPAYLYDVFNTLRDLSLENEFDTRTHEMIDLIQTVRKEKFRKYPPIKPELDIVDDDDKSTHRIELDQPRKEDFHMEFNYFKFDPKWSENEAKYEDFKSGLLEEDESSEDDTSSSDEGANDEIKNDTTEDKKPNIKLEHDVKPDKIIDETGADHTAFRRMIYLTIKSSLSHDEVVHKLMKSNINPELYEELCQMILDCCGQTFDKIYGRVAAKLCQLNRREFAPKFENLLRQFYQAVDLFEVGKLRNTAKFFTKLLTTESIDWSCLNCMRLRENATSSPGRAFIRFLFEELVSELSCPKLVGFIRDPAKEGAFKELFPTEPEEDVIFAINFFRFGGFTELSDILKNELLVKQTNEV